MAAMEMQSFRNAVFLKILIYLAVLSLNCGTWELQSLLGHAGFLVVAYRLSVAGMWDLVP